MTRYVGVVGPGTAVAESLLRMAGDVGRLLAVRGWVVVTGGLGGVMEAAARGASEASGLTVGLLPGDRRASGNPYLSVAIPTGLGELRNALLVRACDGIVAVGCSWGTLSEIALAVRTGVPVVAIDCWDLPQDGPVRVPDAEAAVAALERLWVEPPERKSRSSDFPVGPVPPGEQSG